MTPSQAIAERIILADLDINEIVKAYKEAVKAKADYQAQIDKANEIPTETIEIPTVKRLK